MALPTISEIARVTTDSETRFTQSGKAVTTTRLAFNRSKYNEQTQKWETASTFFVDGTTWERDAERAGQELMKGVEVFVTGDLETEEWEDQQGGKRSKPVLNIRRFKVIPKVAAQQGYGQSSHPQQGGDPWAGQQGAPDQVPF